MSIVAVLQPLVLLRSIGVDEMNAVTRIHEPIHHPVPVVCRFNRDLSGGQQQRVAVARAMIGEPQLILADEPTGNLDSIHGQEVMDSLIGLNESGTTIVMVTHSPTYAACGRRTVNLFDGQVVTDQVGVTGLV
jgi:ABC-type lipoprotein export system ATPase subunit